MAKHAGNDYFEMFVQMSEISCDIAEKLRDVLADFNKDDLFKNMNSLHLIENKGDELMHRLMNNLIREFITPIDREDILTLAREIDDITDSIEDVIQRLYMYNIESIRPDAVEFIDIILLCTKELCNMFMEFKNFKKSKTLHASVVEVNRLEEVGDKLYIKAMRHLYTERPDAYDVIAWTGIYSCFEKCCDTCEHVANIVESTVMNNS